MAQRTTETLVKMLYRTSLLELPKLGIPHSHQSPEEQELAVEILEGNKCNPPRATESYQNSLGEKGPQ